MNLSALTKAQFRSLLRGWVDDESTQRWTDAKLDLLVQVTQDELFARIHDLNPYFTSQLDTISTLTSPGYVELSTALSKRFYRLQHVTRSATEYTEIDRRNVTLEDNELKAAERATRKYLLMGTQLHLFPYETTPEVEVRYAWRPTRFTTLTETGTIEWPDGHESALMFETARRALARGGAEGPTTLDTLASNAWRSLLASASKETLGPITPWLVESPESWGGD